MKRFIFLISLISATLFTQSSMAEGYWGLKASTVDLDANNYSNTLNIGVFVGAEFAQAGSNIISLEGELTTSLIDGDTPISGIDWSVQTMAIYAAMRTGNETYVKLKAGLLDRKITFSTVSGSSSDSGLSWGVGIGFSDYEIEYTFFDGDGSSDLSMISLGYMF